MSKKNKTSNEEMVTLTNSECEAVMVVAMAFFCRGQGLTVGEVAGHAAALTNVRFSAYQMRRALYAGVGRGWVREGIRTVGKRNYKAYTSCSMTAVAAGAMYYCLPVLSKKTGQYVRDRLYDIVMSANDKNKAFPPYNPRAKSEVQHGV